MITRSTQCLSHQEKLTLEREVSSQLLTLVLTLHICLMDASNVQQGAHTLVFPRSERNSPVQNSGDEQHPFLLVVPLSCRWPTPFPSFFFFFSLCSFKAVLKLCIHMHLAFTSCQANCRTGETGKWGLSTDYAETPQHRKTSNLNLPQNHKRFMWSAIQIKTHESSSFLPSCC